MIFLVTAFAWILPLIGHESDQEPTEEQIHTYCMHQIQQFCGTLPPHVGNPLSTLLRDITFTNDGEVHGWGHEGIKWITNCGAYVDVDAWPSMIEVCQNSSATGHLSNKVLLLQTLCSRSNVDERQYLVDILSTLPKCDKFSIIHLMPLIPNALIMQHLPFLQTHWHDTFGIMTHLVQHNPDSLFARYIKADFTTDEAWRLHMKEQWPSPITHTHARRRASSAPPRMTGAPTNGPYTLSNDMAKAAFSGTSPRMTWVD